MIVSFETTHIFIYLLDMTTDRDAEEVHRRLLNRRALR